MIPVRRSVVEIADRGRILGIGLRAAISGIARSVPRLAGGIVARARILGIVHRARRLAAVVTVVPVPRLAAVVTVVPVPRLVVGIGLAVGIAVRGKTSATVRRAGMTTVLRVRARRLVVGIVVRGRILGIVRRVRRLAGVTGTVVRGRISEIAHRVRRLVVVATVVRGLRSVGIGDRGKISVIVRPAGMTTARRVRVRRLAAVVTARVLRLVVVAVDVRRSARSAKDRRVI